MKNIFLRVFLIITLMAFASVSFAEADYYIYGHDDSKKVTKSDGIVHGFVGVSGGIFDQRGTGFHELDADTRTYMSSVTTGYESDGFDNGKNIEVNGVVYFGDISEGIRLGIGANLGYNDARNAFETDSNEGSFDVYTKKAELMLMLFRQFGDWVVYGGAGAGYYMNDLELTIDDLTNPGEAEDHGATVGGVAAIGFKYLFPTGVYAGMEIKGFTNEQEIEINTVKSDYDLGGGIFQVSFGYFF